MSVENTAMEKTGERVAQKTRTPESTTPEGVIPKGMMLQNAKSESNSDKKGTTSNNISTVIPNSSAYDSKMSQNSLSDNNVAEDTAAGGADNTAVILYDPTRLSDNILLWLENKDDAENITGDSTRESGILEATTTEDAEVKSSEIKQDGPAGGQTFAAQPWFGTYAPHATDLSVRKEPEDAMPLAFSVQKDQGNDSKNNNNADEIDKAQMKDVVQTRENTQIMQSPQRTDTIKTEASTQAEAHVRIENLSEMEIKPPTNEKTQPENSVQTDDTDANILSIGTSMETSIETSRGEHETSRTSNDNVKEIENATTELNDARKKAGQAESNNRGDSVAFLDNTQKAEERCEDEELTMSDAGAIKEGEDKDNGRPVSDAIESKESSTATTAGYCTGRKIYPSEQELKEPVPSTETAPKAEESAGTKDEDVQMTDIDASPEGDYIHKARSATTVAGCKAASAPPTAISGSEASPMTSTASGSVPLSDDWPEDERCPLLRAASAPLILSIESNVVAQHSPANRTVIDLTGPTADMPDTERNSSSTPSLRNFEGAAKTGKAPSTLKQSYDKRMANYAATTNAANVPLTQASDSYIPFAGLKFGLLRMTKLLKGGNGVRAWKHWGMVLRLAKLSFFVMHRVTDHFIGEFLVIPLSGEDEEGPGSPELFSEEMKKLHDMFKTKIREYLRKRIIKIEELLRTRQMSLKTMQKNDLQNFLNGFWDGGVKEEAMAMWKPVAEVIDWDIIFSPPQAGSAGDLNILESWENYLRDCFVQSVELYLTTRPDLSRGCAKSFYDNWCTMIESGSVLKPPNISRVPVTDHVEIPRGFKSRWMSAARS